MKRRNLLILLALSATLPFVLLAEAKKPETFGPYTVLDRNAEIVKDVKVTDTGRIYLLLNPKHKEKEIVLKNSQQFKSGYRNWYNGEKELISQANQGKAPNEFTDWVVTSANYVEYYMDGDLILHLAKTDVHTPGK